MESQRRQTGDTEGKSQMTKDFEKERTVEKKGRNRGEIKRR